MALLQIILFLLLCAVALGWVARHFKFPYPIALVIGGGLLGFVPRLPQLQFDPEFLLVLVLPPILYQAALLTSWRDFKANIRPIGLLAIGLVIVTTLAVGATLKLLVPDIPWAAAFVLGAIVSPPDVVAATAILSRLTIPRTRRDRPRGREPGQRRHGPGDLQVRRGGGAHRDVLAARRGRAVHRGGGRRRGDRHRNRVAVRRHPPAPRGRVHRGADHPRGAVRHLHPRGIRARVGRARRGRRGDHARALFARNRLGRDAHHGPLGLEPVRVPDQQPGVHPHRRAALGDDRKARRALGGAAPFLRDLRFGGRDLRALRLGLSRDLSAAQGARLARPPRAKTPRGGGVHHGLVRDARHRVARGGPRPAAGARGRQARFRNAISSSFSLSSSSR